MVTSVANLRGQIELHLVDACSDGVVWARLVDAHGGAALVSIDGRADSATRFRLFDRARHPEDAEAVLLELGGPEEGIVVPLLSQWCDSEAASESHLQVMVEAMLLRLGSND